MAGSHGFTEEAMAGVPLKRRRRPGRLLKPAKTAFRLRERCRSRTGRHHAGRDRSTGPIRAAGARARARHAGSRQAARKARGDDDLSSFGPSRWTCCPPKAKLLNANICANRGFDKRHVVPLHMRSSHVSTSPKMTARLPSLNGLRAFEAAARHLSFTLAAAELNVTQTAISHQIKRLEEELGVRLFIRQNRSLTLTQQAQEYLPGIRAAFNDLRLATDRLLRKDDDNVLTVSTLASLAAKWLLPRISDFQEKHPGIDVRITTSTALVD